MTLPVRNNGENCDASYFNDIKAEIEGLTTDAYEQLSLISNAGLSYSGAAGIGTVTLTQSDGSTAPTALLPVSIGFRNLSATTGGYEVKTVTSSISLTLDSGATLGVDVNAGPRIYIYAINNAGTIELAASLSKQFDEDAILSTTLLDSSADDAYTLYSNTARTSLAVRLIGYLELGTHTPGSWPTTSTNLFPNSLWTPAKFFGHYYDYAGLKGSSRTALPRFPSQDEKFIGNKTVLSPQGADSTGLQFYAVSHCLVRASFTSSYTGTGETSGWGINTSNASTDIDTVQGTDSSTVLAIGRHNDAKDISCTLVMKPGDILRPYGSLGGNQNSYARWNITITAEEI